MSAVLAQRRPSLSRALLRLPQHAAPQWHLGSALPGLVLSDQLFGARVLQVTVR